MGRRHQSCSVRSVALIVGAPGRISGDRTDATIEPGTREPARASETSRSSRRSDFSLGGHAGADLAAMFQLMRPSASVGFRRYPATTGRNRR